MTAVSSCANLLNVESYASGVIFSNMHKEYSDDMNCSWSISSNAKLEFTFIRFQTESGYDYVKVYDGPSSSSTLIGKYDGDSLPASIISSSHELFVTFTSDGSVTKSGFLANYHSKYCFDEKYFLESRPSKICMSCLELTKFRAIVSAFIFNSALLHKI